MARFLPQLAVAAVATLLATTGAATDFYVSTSGNDANPGTSWSQAVATVPAALTLAAAISGADLIHVAPGRYPGTFTLPAGVTLRGSESPLTGRIDPDQTPSILDGAGSGPVVTCDPAANDATLEGFVVTGGVNAAAHGGGIVCVTASATFRNNRIVGNSTTCAGCDGGGMSASDGGPVIEGNLFARNTSAAAGGGLRLSRTTAAVRQNAFVGNVATTSDGGGLRLRDSNTAAVLVEDNVFAENRATLNGGGFAAVNSLVDARRNAYERNLAAAEGGGLSYRDCTVRADSTSEVAIENTATSSAGGISYKNTAGTVSRALSLDNSTGADGGGMRAKSGGPVTVADSVFAGNTAKANGGGISLLGVNGTVRNLLARGNHASDGGGVVVDDVVGTPTVPGVVTAVAVTVIDNDVTKVGGVSGARVNNGSSLALSDAILWGNVGGADTGGAGTFTTSYCDAPVVLTGTGNISLDPLFVAGPLTGPWALGSSYLSATAAGQPATSPGVDAGDQPSASLGLDVMTTRTDDVGDAGTVDLGFHAARAAGGFWGFDVYRSLSARTPGMLYMAGVKPPSVADAEPVLNDTSRPLLSYHLRGRSTLKMVKNPTSVVLWF